MAIDGNIWSVLFVALSPFLFSLLKDFGVLGSTNDSAFDRLRLTPICSMIFLVLLRSSLDITPICRAIS
jgi:hypothetical protein